MEKKILSVEDKNRLAQFLLESCIDGKPVYGKIKEAATLFGVDKKTVARLWAKAQIQINEGKPISLLNPRVGVTYNKKQLFDAEKLKNIKWNERSTIRDLAKGMEVGKSTVARWVNIGLVKVHSNAIKPLLTDSNKLQRILYCLSQLHIDRVDNKIKFGDMRNVIHIDEKWFYLTEVTKKSYKLPEEKEQYRCCKSKRFIIKVMFMCAVGRPQYASDGTLLFDGKIGIFPFTEQVQAKRNSKNRLRGTMETKNLESITKEVIKNCIITQIIPTLKSKWPNTTSKDIIIQQDNAKPHISNNDPDFRAVACSDGFNIQLVCQPPNSPDTNILDLGFFRSIQSLQQKKKAKNVEGIIKNVNDAFGELTSATLNNVFLSLQDSCIEMMKVKGHNAFKQPHMGKEILIREDLLPDCLEVDEVLVKECIEFLKLPGNEVQSKYDVQPLMTDLGY